MWVGFRLQQQVFLQKIRSLCDHYNAVFIADSVQCGYGRTGKFYSHDFAGVDADIYTMAKGMGNGFPIGGISISQKIKPVYYMLGTTFGGNHLACAAGLAVLEVMERDNLMQNAAEVGGYLIQELKKFDQIKEVRGRGLMIGIDLPPSLAHVKAELLFKYHIFTGEAKPNVIRLLPALNLTKAYADRFLESFSLALQNAPVAVFNPSDVDIFSVNSIFSVVSTKGRNLYQITKAISVLNKISPFGRNDKAYNSIYSMKLFSSVNDVADINALVKRSIGFEKKSVCLAAFGEEQNAGFGFPQPKFTYAHEHAKSGHEFGHERNGSQHR